jgi:hypothetical protein
MRLSGLGSEETLVCTLSIAYFWERTPVIQKEAGKGKGRKKKRNGC